LTNALAYLISEFITVLIKPLKKLVLDLLNLPAKVP
jgi:hypothetical protein